MASPPAAPPAKISDKLAALSAAGRVSVSYEFFPPKTDEGVRNLIDDLERSRHLIRPTFVSLTHRSAAAHSEERWLGIGSQIQHRLGVDVLLHLTCHKPKAELIRILHRVREAGIRNILALRGDSHDVSGNQWRPPRGGFRNAIELVQLIREEHGDHFCIGVAGYSEVHSESWNSSHLQPSARVRALDISRLKAKVDAGADFIVTQHFYDVDGWLDWRVRAKAAGISCPIIPGYLVVQNYSTFERFTEWCRTRVPPQVARDLAKVKSDDRAVNNYGIRLAIDTCRTLVSHRVRALHFFTSNLVTAFIDIVAELAPELGLLEGGGGGASGGASGGNSSSFATELEVERSHSERALSGVFPGGASSPSSSKVLEPNASSAARIPLATISRSPKRPLIAGGQYGFANFPNGRWGDRSSPAYGQLTDHYLANKRNMDTRVDRRLQWGLPQSEEDVRAVFLRYVLGEINELPWCESGGLGLSDESERIAEDLLFLNAHGFLTINSQPRANCVPSDDPVFGWGSAGGFVFQKAYVEAWVSPKQWEGLHALLQLPEFASLSYQSINSSGAEHTNIVQRDPMKRCVNAVTWGVFPGQEIQQPTVVDHVSFRTWTAEAFELWRTAWRRLYEEPSSDSSPRLGPDKLDSTDDAVRTAALSIDAEAKAARARSREVLNQVHDTYWLVNIVDQDYDAEESDIFAIFRRLVSSAMGEAELRQRVLELEAGVTTLRDDLMRAGELQRRTLEHVSSLERNNARLRRQLHEARTAALEQEARSVISRPAARAGVLSGYSPSGATYRKSPSSASRLGRGNPSAKPRTSGRGRSRTQSRSRTRTTQRARDSPKSLTGTGSQQLLQEMLYRKSGS